MGVGKRHRETLPSPRCDPDTPGSAAETISVLTAGFASQTDEEVRLRQNGQAVSHAELAGRLPSARSLNLGTSTIFAYRRWGSTSMALVL